MHKLYTPNGYGSVESPAPTINHDDTDGSSYYVPLKCDCHDDYHNPSSYLQIKMQHALRKSCDFVLHSLGFCTNPVVASSPQAVYRKEQHAPSAVVSNDTITQQPLVNQDKNNKRNSSHADMRLSMVSNFSAAYNTINISLALALMKSTHPPRHSADVSLCSSALIAGMILGQLIGGFLGDWLGRHVAMSVVMALQVTAAFWSGWVGLDDYRENYYWDIYHVLAVCRFLLGVGCGGVYPLAATLTAESSSQERDRGKLVALTFSMQGVGYLAVSLTAYVMVAILGEESDLAWRLLLAFGSLPGLGLIVIRVFTRRKSNAKQSTNNCGGEDNAQSSANQTTAKQVRLQPKSLFEQVRNEPNLLYKITGTAGCWLMFDILFYGNTLFQPIVFAAAFGKSETILAIVRDSTLIALMALPGYFTSVYMIGIQTPRRIQLQGFLMMALLYAIIGVRFDGLGVNRLALMTLYGLTFFFSNYGPNTTVRTIIV
jgi:PHS family inorganic phosphate transporter-like MFS transporter